MWQDAEVRDVVLALWAAALVTRATGDGKWAATSFALRRMWLNDLQGKPSLYAN